MVLKDRLRRTISVIGLTMFMAILAGPSVVFGAEHDDPGKPTPIGAWFGVARPCVYSPQGIPIDPLTGHAVLDPAPDPTICGLTGATAPNIFPIVQVTMIPTLLADGTVLADDFGELLDHHTTAQGKWESVGKVEIDGKKLDKYQATFVWFSGPLPGVPVSQEFIGSIRPRFVTFFDKDKPDEMRGYIQPYLYLYTKPSADPVGQVNFDSNGKFPVPSPTDPLPTTCDPNPNSQSNPKCLGTLHFYIHRIPAH